MFKTSKTDIFRAFSDKFNVFLDAIVARAIKDRLILQQILTID